ncbi:UDP-N-acetylmuramate--L-alanine ligase [Aureivirga sp. CE67]|uniref:UDP-N-acetylmuramate--L-alanine ligase n=1 Tax=Aureivirga sp. CE67 TaxID=1788983 RepID=UPI0018C9702D|nr:Mur ligase family protein [Aureivirga sp. CE67]
MNIHFIAIGGSAMHNLAISLKKKGHTISGSDDTIFEPSKSRLQKQDLLPEQFGWFPEKITSNLDAIILGMHAKENNPELLKAQELGIKVYSYPEFIYEQSKDKTRVVIGGSHGKTTITAMILHVLNYHGMEVDYMVGAQLDGFDTMVNLTNDNEFIILEGDEYLSSPIDRRPKFHLYKPNIALISGISWDHINVFPTKENYNEQFKTFVDSITNGGILVYNEDDTELSEIVESSENPIKKYPYQTPEYSIEDGITYLDTFDGMVPLEVFGKHNLQNIAGAKWICQCIGIGEEEFYEAISSFKGANKRLEKIYSDKNTTIFKDFAHSPSKVEATTNAVKEQYTSRKVIACFELHTYSSLSSEFLNNYKNSLDKADEAIVFFDLEALKIKEKNILDTEEIKNAFNHPNLKVFSNTNDLKDHIDSLKLENSILLMMSSGNYGGLNLLEIIK